MSMTTTVCGEVYQMPARPVTPPIRLAAKINASVSASERELQGRDSSSELCWLPDVDSNHDSQI